MTFVMQRISVAVQKAVAKEVSDALGFAVDEPLLRKYAASDLGRGLHLAEGCIDLPDGQVFLLQGGVEGFRVAY